MGIKMSALDAQSIINDTDIFHLRTAGGLDKKITGAELVAAIGSNAEASEYSALRFKGIVTNKSDLPTTDLTQGDTYLVINSGSPAGKMFSYVEGLYSEVGGWFDHASALLFADYQFRGLASPNNWFSADAWNPQAAAGGPSSTHHVVILASNLSLDVSTTVKDLYLGLCDFTVSGTRTLTVRNQLHFWPTTLNLGAGFGFSISSQTYSRDIYVLEGIIGRLTLFGAFNFYMSGNLFCQYDGTANPPISWTNGKLWINGHNLHWIGDTTTEYTVVLVAADFDNQTAGGLLVLRGKLGLNTSNHDLEDVHAKDLSSNTYIRQYSNCTVNNLTIDANVTWDRNGFTLTIDGVLVNNGSLIG